MTTTEPPKRKLPHPCRDDLPTLIVRDVIITEKNWDT